MYTNIKICNTYELINNKLYFHNIFIQYCSYWYSILYIWSNIEGIEFFTKFIQHLTVWWEYYAQPIDVNIYFVVKKMMVSIEPGEQIFHLQLSETCSR
jgi:hypothetical protein